MTGPATVRDIMIPRESFMPGSATLLDLAVRLDSSLSPVVVTVDGACAGLVGASDVATAVAAGKEPATVRLSEVVGNSAPPHQARVSTGASISEARAELILEGADLVCVVEDEALVGIVLWPALAAPPDRAPDGLPVPPLNLIRLVAGGGSQIPSGRRFYESGARTADMIGVALKRYGKPVEECHALLDFGCGCGRVIRHWRDLRSTEAHGCDYNSELIDWCRENLPFAQFELNDLSPRLPFDSGRFDLVYAVSVFTHLPEELQLGWMDELRRVLAPGGMLLVTLHGESFLAQLDAAGQEAFRAGRLVVTGSAEAGSNWCAAYHPARYIEETFSKGFELVAHLPRAAREMRQDVLLMAKPNA